MQLLKNLSYKKFPAMFDCAYSPDGTVIASVSKKHVSLNSGLDGESLWAVKAVSDPAHCALSIDGLRVAVKNTSGRIAVLSASTGQIVADSRRSEGEGTSIFFSPCGQYLVDGSWAGKLTVRNADDLKIVRTVDFGSEMVNHLSRSGNGLRWYVARQARTKPGEQFAPPPILEFFTWDSLDSRECIQTPFQRINLVEGSVCGGYVAIIGSRLKAQSSTLMVVDVAQNSHESIELAPALYRDLSWSSDGRMLSLATADTFGILSSRALKIVASVPVRHGAVFRFGNSNSLLVGGTWESGDMYQIHQSPEGLRDIPPRARGSRHTFQKADDQ